MAIQQLENANACKNKIIIIIIINSFLLICFLVKLHMSNLVKCVKYLVSTKRNAF